MVKLDRPPLLTRAAQHVILRDLDPPVDLTPAPTVAQPNHRNHAHRLQGEPPGCTDTPAATGMHPGDPTAHYRPPIRARKGLVVADEPTPSELRRLYETLREDQRRGFSELNTRLDRMPTSELLMAHLQGWQKQLDSVRDEQVSQRVHIDTEIAKVEAAVDLERKDRQAQHKAEVDGRRWQISAVVIPILLSLLALAAATGVIG